MPELLTRQSIARAMRSRATNGRPSGSGSSALGVHKGEGLEPCHGPLAVAPVTSGVPGVIL
jgi:hypothetical protein